MAINNPNNNNSKLVTATYTNISYPNPNGVGGGSRFGISYLNGNMRVAIGNKVGDTYEKDTPTEIYISPINAKLLSDGIATLYGENPNGYHNTAIVTQKGALIVDDGSKYGAPVISILAKDKADNEVFAQYQCRDIYTSLYDYDAEAKTATEVKDNAAYQELQFFKNSLDRFYDASSRAVAASVHEVEAYSFAGVKNLLIPMAEKLGVKSENGNSGNSSRSSFYNGNSSSGSSVNKPTTTGSIDDLFQ